MNSDSAIYLLVPLQIYNIYVASTFFNTKMKDKIIEKLSDKMKLIRIFRSFICWEMKAKKRSDFWHRLLD